MAFIPLALLLRFRGGARGFAECSWALEGEEDAGLGVCDTKRGGRWWWGGSFLGGGEERTRQLAGALSRRT